TSDDGADTTGDGLLPASVSRSITCDGLECDVDIAFARALYDTPERLLGDRTRLEYDPMIQRHRFIDVKRCVLGRGRLGERRAARVLLRMRRPWRLRRELRDGGTGTSRPQLEARGGHRWG